MASTFIAGVEALALLAAIVALAAVGASLEQSLELGLVHHLGSYGGRLFLCLLLALGHRLVELKQKIFTIRFLPKQEE